MHFSRSWGLPPPIIYLYTSVLNARQPTRFRPSLEFIKQEQPNWRKNSNFLNFRTKTCYRKMKYKTPNNSYCKEKQQNSIGEILQSHISRKECQNMQRVSIIFVLLKEHKTKLYLKNMEQTISLLRKIERFRKIEN